MYGNMQNKQCCCDGRQLNLHLLEGCASGAGGADWQRGYQAGTLMHVRLKTRPCITSWDCSTNADVLAISSVVQLCYIKCYPRGVEQGKRLSAVLTLK